MPTYCVILTEDVIMLSEKDAKIISQLRNNARKKITKISGDLKVPVTTVYDRVRVQENRIIKKHTSLLDFTKLGYLSSAYITIKVPKDSREKLLEYIVKKPNVNSIYKTNFNSDFLVECVFKNPSDLNDFKEKLEEEFNSNVQIFNIIKEIKKEEFLTKPEHLEA